MSKRERLDDLADAGPAGALTGEGWCLATPATRAERLLFDAERQVANAAAALHAGMVGSPEERTAALFFIAGALRHHARLIGRARAVLAAEAGSLAKRNPSPRTGRSS